MVMGEAAARLPTSHRRTDSVDDDGGFHRGHNPIDLAMITFITSLEPA